MQLKMVKCSNCKQDGHTKRKCPNQAYEEPEVEEAAPVKIRLTQVVSQRLAKLETLCQEVATHMGKGHVEGVYQQALCCELQEAAIRYVSEETMPILYKGRPIGGGHSQRLDIVVMPEWLPFIFELKAEPNQIKPKHHWQVVRYMTYKGLPYGAVVNFNQSERGSFEIQFIVLQEGRHYLYDPESQTGRELLDFSMTRAAEAMSDDDVTTEEE